MLRALLGSGLAMAVMLGVFVAPATAAGTPPPRLIFMNDACDPVTFNAMIGDGTCVRSGGVPLNLFLAQVQRLHRAPAWSFVPGTVVATSADPIEVRNIGGELHTFTEVAQFGGGFVPLLNQLAGNLTEVPECAAPPGDDNHFVPAGGSFVFTESESGTHLYQCCIHPWMHARLTIRSAPGILETRP